MSQLKRTDARELNMDASSTGTLSIQAILEKANALKQDGQLEAALKYYDQAIATEPTAYLAFYQKGEILAGQNKNNQAIAHYQKSISLNPQFPWSYNSLGLVYLRTQNFEKSISVFQKAAALKPKSALFKSQLGNAFLKSGNLTEAATALAQSVALDPTLSATQLHLAALATALGDYAKAIVHYKNAISLNPSPFWPYRAIADLSRKVKNYTQSIEYYHQAIARKPNFANGHVELGKLYQQRGDIDRALQCYIKALNIDLDCEMAHTALRYTPVSPAQLDELTLAYQSIITKAPQASFVWGSLGDAFSQKGHIPRAIHAYRTSCYHRVVKKRPNLKTPDVNAQKTLGPDYIIIGAGKCGTTSLHKYIGTHPDVFLPHKKEINFFNRERDKGLAWYLAHFPAIADSPQFITGESTPDYFSYPGVDEDIHAVFPNTKLIVLLRNPVDRAISWYHHNVKRGLESRSFSSILETELEQLHRAPQDAYSTINGHIGGSLYVYKLQRWLSSFSKQQCLIIKSEDFYQNTRTIMADVFQFLNLSPFDLPTCRKHNVGDYKKADVQERQMLQEIFRPHNQKLNDYLSRDFDWD